MAHLRGRNSLAALRVTLRRLPGVTAYIHDMSHDRPGVAAVAINDRDKAWHDIFHVDIAHRRARADR